MSTLLPSLDEKPLPARGARSPVRQIFDGSVWYAIAVVVNRFVPGILTVILAWWLEPRELGIISFVMAYYAILSLVADWSIAYAIQKLIPENRERAGQVAWTALFMRLGFSTVLGLACWGADAATRVFRGYGICLALLLITSSFGIIVYVHNASCRFALGSLFSIAVYVVWLPLALILVKLGLRTTGPLLALCISFAASGMSGFLFDPALREQMAFVRSIAVQILRFGAWATVATLLSSFADQVGILVVAYRIGDASAGLFKVATTFGVFPALLGMIVVLPLMPIAKRSLLNGEDVSSTLIRPLLRYLLLLGLPIAAAGFVLAQPIIRTFVRDSYLGAVWPMRILLGASLLRMLVTAFSGILFVGQELKDLAMIHGMVAAIALLGGVFLARVGGVTAVAAANLASWTVGAALLYRFFDRKVALRLEWGRYLRYAASAAVMAGFVLLAAKLVHPALGQLLLGGCVAGVVYLLLIVCVQRDLGIQEFVRTLWSRTAG
jgi:O-antigen/teichoic acid export membrane protein